MENNLEVRPKFNSTKADASSYQSSNNRCFNVLQVHWQSLPMPDTREVGS